MRYLLMFMNLLLLTGSAAIADLEWESTVQEITVHPLQASAMVKFEFTNRGSEKVEIIGIKADCGCITGQVDKTAYAPGESGAIAATFNFEGRVGEQQKSLMVTTDDHPEKPTRLSINTSIPKVYSVSTQRLVWVGGQREPQTFSLVNVSKTPFRIEKAVSSHAGISIELKPIREGFEYELIVTPDPKLGKTLAPITIYPEKPEGMDAVRTYMVYAMVL